MTPRQILVAQRLTTRAHRTAQGMCDVPMIWTVRQLSHRTVELLGSNVGLERRWFDEARTFQAFIGPRGGVEISSATSKFYT